MQVVITLAGHGQRFSDKGFIEPKPMVPVAGRPALFYLIDSFDPHWSLNFVLAEHDRSSQLEAMIKKKSPLARVIYTPFSERGPIDTVLAAIPFLDSQRPVLVSYCDLAPVWDTSKFAEEVAGFDLASVNYQGFHPTYFGPNSYCHMRVEQLIANTEPENKNDVVSVVAELQEKVLFTDEIEKEITSAGLYFFKNKELLQTALNEQLAQDLKYKKEFYVSLALQALLNKNSSLRALDYRVSQVVQFGTPADTERFEFWFQYLIRGEIRKEFLHIEDGKNPLQLGADVFEKEKLYWQKVFRYFK